MALQTSEVTYEADGLAMRGHLAWDDAQQGPRPGVLVIPEIFGLGEHAMKRAERLAMEFGYVGFASDLWGDREIINDMAQVAERFTALCEAPAGMLDRARKPMDVLAARPEVDESRIAAIGFCFGGTMAFELAMSGADLKAAIGFHSRLTPPSLDDAAKVKGKILALIGADDPGILNDQRVEFEEKLRAGGVDWQLHLYGGVVHSFTDPAADARGMDHLRYDATADARSWKAMELLMEEVFA